jgi:hypothetical protein
VAVGAVTAVLALLALTAMHALPMAMGHGDTAAASDVSDAAVMPGMHAGHVDGMAMASTGESGHAAAAAVHSTDGVPPHGHSLLHLCVAVLVAGLSLALVAGFWRRPWAGIALSRMALARAVLTRDTGPPSLAGLCLLRC